MTTLSRERIVAAKARADAATEGPWEAHTLRLDTDSWIEVARIRGYRLQIVRRVSDARDAEFIASARADVPVMADALLRVLDLHHEMTWRIETTVGAAKMSQGCAGCGGVWPCATVRAVIGGNIGP